MGVRRALGAQTGQILRLILGQGAALALAGTVVGILGALALSTVIRSLLFQVNPTDPLTFIAVPLLFLLVALVASYVPAQRATRVDPIAALRVS
jgi:ABC-type antimicrobial peptide transport system permease subunit